MACGFVRINGGQVSTGVAIIAILFIFSLACPYTQAQTSASFTPASNFSIPAYNGNISFAVNGTYSNASLENNTWTFTNLHLNKSKLLESFEISAQNSNVTIISYETANNSEVQSATLRCGVVGHGEQILNFGLGSGGGELDWSISVNGTDIGGSVGQGWNVSHNGTVVVNGQTGELNIVRYDYFVSNSNQPFYQQHSVAIVTVVIIAITVIIAVAIKITTREHSNDDELVKNDQANHQSLSIKQITGRTSDGV
jgi:hypothetical protein